MTLSMTLKGMLLFVTGDLASGMALIEEARRIQERLNDCEGGGIAPQLPGADVLRKGRSCARARVVWRGARLARNRR